MALFRAIHLGWHSDALDRVFWFGSYSGLGQVQVIAALPLLFFRAWRPLFWQILGCVLGPGLVFVHTFKRLMPRDRPSQLLDSLPQEPHRLGSFPSGHTTTAFAIATVLWLYGARIGNRWMGAAGFVWATLVGLSRIYRGVHWPSDVLAGACLGIAGGIVVFWIAERFSRPSPPSAAVAT